MEILIAIAILGGLGVVFGLVLAAASKLFYVQTDPRLEALNDALPAPTAAVAAMPAAMPMPRQCSKGKRLSMPAPPADRSAPTK